MTNNNFYMQRMSHFKLDFEEMSVLVMPAKHHLQVASVFVNCFVDFVFSCILMSTFGNTTQ